MSTNVNWIDILGWEDSQLQDLRFVGYSYIKQGKWDIALTFFEALHIIEPQHAYNLQTLGALYLQKNNNFKALNFIERALKIDPLNESTLLNRTKALFALGLKKQALLQASSLAKSAKDKKIASQAEALILSYS